MFPHTMEQATRVLLRPSSTLRICSTCRRKLQSLKPFASHVRFNSTSNSQITDQATPITGYYAELLKHPNSLTHPSLQSRPQSQPPAPVPDQEVPLPEPSAKFPPADPPKFDPSNPASTARIVFGSRLAGPARAASRAAASQRIAGVLVPPRPLEPDNCCMSGCVNCVWDIYREELEEWAMAAAKAKAALQAQSAKPKKKKAKKDSVAERAMTMDEDGGGSEANWAAQFTDAGKSQDELMKDIPVGIREFMRTEKMLKKKHMEEAEAGGRR